MGVFNDILNNIDFKGNKANITIKTIIAISMFLIGSAFFIGQIKTKHLDKLNDIEELSKQNLDKNVELEDMFKESIFRLETKIDNIYVDGFEAFDDYREFNNRQLKLIIDYNNDNKELLKELIEIKSDEKAFEIKSNLNKDTISNHQKKISVEKIDKQ